MAESVTSNQEVERAFGVLETLGIPRERARSVPNGIIVLDQRYAREIAALRAEVKRLNELVADHEEARRTAGETPDELAAVCEEIRNKAQSSVGNYGLGNYVAIHRELLGSMRAILDRRSAKAAAPHTLAASEQAGASCCHHGVRIGMPCHQCEARAINAQKTPPATGWDANGSET